MAGIRKSGSVLPISWILLGLVISIWSATFPFGGLEDPGPAILPFACGVILILLGSILYCQARAHAEEDPAKLSTSTLLHDMATRRVAFGVIGMLLSAAFFEPLGFGLTVFFMILFLMRSIHPQKWRVILFYALVSSLGSYIVFKVLLKTPLPGGFLGL